MYNNYSINQKNYLLFLQFYINLKDFLMGITLTYLAYFLTYSSNALAKDSAKKSSHIYRSLISGHESHLN